MTNRSYPEPMTILTCASCGKRLDDDLAAGWVQWSTKASVDHERPVVVTLDVVCNRSCCLQPIDAVARLIGATECHMHLDAIAGRWADEFAADLLGSLYTPAPWIEQKVRQLALFMASQSPNNDSARCRIDSALSGFRVEVERGAGRYRTEYP